MKLEREVIAGLLAFGFLIETGCSTIKDIVHRINSKDLQNRTYKCPFDSYDAIDNGRRSVNWGEYLTFKVSVCKNCLPPSKLRKGIRLEFDFYENERFVSSNPVEFNSEMYDKLIELNWGATPGSYTGRISYNGILLKEIPNFSITYMHR